MKCAICNRAIETTFLGKITGTYVKDGKGRLHTVCFECQKKFGSKQELLREIS